MKDRILTYISLAFSVAALGYSAWLHQNADHAAVRALRQRELEFVTAYAPRMKDIHSAMTDKTEAFAAPPQTVEELFKPITDIIAKFEGSDPPDSPPHILKIPNEVPH